MLTKVIKMGGDEEELWFSLPPHEAVIAAHAHGLGDGATWTFGKYRKLVEVGRHHVFCGHWAARLEAPGEMDDAVRR